MSAIDETLRSTVGRDAEVPRKRRVSDMGAKYILDRIGERGLPHCAQDKKIRKREGTMATRTARKTTRARGTRNVHQSVHRARGDSPSVNKTGGGSRRSHGAAK